MIANGTVENGYEIKTECCGGYGRRVFWKATAMNVLDEVVAERKALLESQALNKLGLALGIMEHGGIVV